MQSRDEIFHHILTSGPKTDHRSLMIFFSLLVLVGAVTFLAGISGSQSQRAWQAYLINFLFWSGLAFGSVFFVAILNITSARWGRPMKRLAEAPGAFLPISFLLFWVLYFGREKIFPWIIKPVPGKEVWLNAPFLFARDGLALFLLTAVSMALLYYSLRGERKVIPRQTALKQTGGNDLNQEGWAEEDSNSKGDWRVQVTLSPILGILYGLVLTLVAFDLIMSLDPHWYSTLFGGYYFVGSFYTALAGLVILSGLSLKTIGMTMSLEKFLRPRHFHDLGKLLFAFCMLTGYLFYAQFLVIWYGNIPEEARYIIQRISQGPWGPLAWLILGVCFGLPFIVLLSRKIKMKPGAMMILSIIILAGMWLERFLLVAPSLWGGQGIPLGLIEALITAGFFGVMALTVMIFLQTFPLLPISDPLFLEELKAVQAEGEE